MAKDKRTEKQILEAAEKVFQSDGYAGARMQAIADKADINKGLLHYYFKTKDKLFDKIFEKAIDRFIGKVTSALNSDLPLFEKIESFVAMYLQILSRNSYLPSFIIHELNKRPEAVISKIVDNPNAPDLAPLKTQINQCIENGVIKPIKAEHLIINIISLCVFPYVAKPMMRALLTLNKKEVNQLVEDRKNIIAGFVIDAIKT